MFFGRNSDFLPGLEDFNSNLLLHFTDGGLPFLGNTTSFLQMEGVFFHYTGYRAKPQVLIAKPLRVQRPHLDTRPRTLTCQPRRAEAPVLQLAVGSNDGIDGQIVL